MSERSLEEKLDQLYAADPADFVALRKQLQGELRASGEKAEAKRLGAARRPSTSMWALNQLARRRPELIDTMLERAEELRRAQTRPGSDSDALRTAIRAHRAALEDAAAAAVDVLGARANEAFREEILSMLRSASSETEAGRDLRLGRLVRSDDVTQGFPELVGDTPEPEGHVDAPQSASKRRRRESPTENEHARQTAAEEEAAREAETQAQLTFDRARADEALAEGAAAEAQRRVDELDEQLASARRELREARSRVQRAHAETVRAAASLERRSNDMH